MPKIGSIGIPELLIILVVVLLIFGPRRLPDMAKGLGQSVREFRRGLRDMRKEFDDESNEKDPAAPGASTSASTMAPRIVKALTRCVCGFLKNPRLTSPLPRPAKEPPPRSPMPRP